jgi:hypothetical protein
VPRGCSSTTRFVNGQSKPESPVRGRFDRSQNIRETNRPRLEELLPALTDDAPTENTTQDTTEALPAAAAAAAPAPAIESDPVTDSHPM